MPRKANTVHDPGGHYQKECPHCHIIFRTDNPRLKYCSKACKRTAANQRYYEQHGDEHRARMREEMRKRRGS